MEEQQITQYAGILQGALNSGDLESAVQALQGMDQYDVEIKLTLTAPQQTVYSQAQGQYAPAQRSYPQGGPQQSSYYQAQDQYSTYPQGGFQTPQQTSYPQAQGQYPSAQSSYQQSGAQMLQQSSYSQGQYPSAQSSYLQGGTQAYSQSNDSQQTGDWVYDQNYKMWYNTTTGQYATN